MLLETLKSGAIIAYPTESFYALGADATNLDAIQRVFKLKQRDKNPIALIASDAAQVKKFFRVSSVEERLMKKYWPGAVTILLRPKKVIAAKAGIAVTTLAPTTPSPSRRRQSGFGASATSGRRGTLIGIRVPAHAGARRLAARAGVPLTATSANLAGQPPTKSARMIKRRFPDILIAPGRCGRATKPSTVIRVSGKAIHIIRQGSVHVHPPAA